MDNHNNELSSDKLCKTGAIAETSSEYIMPNVQNGPFIAKIPIVISKSKVSISIESTVMLDQPAVDIRGCSGDVYLNYCKLFYEGKKRYGKLFLNGYIDEKIEYSGVHDANGKYTNGNIRFFNVKIPFECSAIIEYYCPPIVRKPNSLLPVKLLGTCLNPEDLNNHYGREQNPEELFCEIEEANILDRDITRQISHTKVEGTDNSIFEALYENMTISITLLLLQRRLVKQ